MAEHNLSRELYWCYIGCMPAPPGPSTAAPSRFTFVGGDASTDFVNTVDWTAAGLQNDELGDYAAVTRWAEQAGLVAGSAAAHLRQVASERPAEARATLAQARELRSLLHRVFAAVAEERAPDSADIDGLNHRVGIALRHLVLAPGGKRPRALAAASGAALDRRSSITRALAWTWRSPEADLSRVLWPVARAAATLLTSDDVRRIRLCPGDDCGWAYVDRSRNGQRRWCEMRTCGAREKARRYYARRRS